MYCMDSILVYKHCSTRIHIRHKISSIQEHDEPILKTLTSIDLKFIDEEKASEDSSEESKEGNMVRVNVWYICKL